MVLLLPLLRLPLLRDDKTGGKVGGFRCANDKESAAAEFAKPFSNFWDGKEGI
jgi:hypothetical protein